MSEMTSSRAAKLENRGTTYMLGWLSFQGGVAVDCTGHLTVNVRVGVQR